MVSKMRGPVAAQVAEMEARNFAGVLGGDFRGIPQIINNRAEQERLASEDPNNILRVAGQYVEATGGASELELQKAKERLEWRATREDQRAEYKARLDVSKKLGLGMSFVFNTDDSLNKSSMGFEDKTTGMFKRRNKLPENRGVMDYATEEQVALRKVGELAIKRKLSEALKTGATQEEVSEVVTQVTDRIHETGDALEIHISKKNPFVKMNRRLILPAERAAASVNGKEIASVTLKPQSIKSIDLVDYIPQPFPANPKLQPAHGVMISIGLMKSLGFGDAKVFRASVNAKDKGVDIVSEKAVAQVKVNFKSSTSRGEISQFCGDTDDSTPHDGKIRLFFSHKMSDEAAEKADLKKIAWFCFDIEGKFEAMNDAAIELENASNEKKRAQVSHDRSVRQKKALAALPMATV